MRNAYIVLGEEIKEYIKRVQNSIYSVILIA